MAISPPGAALGVPLGGAAAAPAPTAEDEFTATLAQTVFTLTQSAAAGGVVVLTINGQRFAEGTDFTISGTTLTWLDTPFTLEAGDAVVITYNHI
jgi:hypothetical protein